MGMDHYHATLLMKCVEMVNCHCEADPEFKEKCLRSFGEDDFEMINVWKYDSSNFEEEEMKPTTKETDSGGNLYAESWYLPAYWKHRLLSLVKRSGDNG